MATMTRGFLLAIVFIWSGRMLHAGTIMAPFTDSPPILDGILNDSCWNAAYCSDQFYVYNQLTAANHDTKAHLVVDNEYLYLGAACAHPAPGDLVINAKSPNDRVFGDECLKVFLVSGTSGKGYRFVVNPENTVDITSSCEGQTAPPKWLYHAARCASGWSVEIAIPLERLKACERMHNWRLNIFRRKIVKEYDAQGANISAKNDIFTWAPANDWIDPAHMWTLAGLPDNPVKEAFMVAFGSEPQIALNPHAGQGTHMVTTRIKTLSSRGGEAELSITENGLLAASERIACRGKCVETKVIELQLKEALPTTDIRVTLFNPTNEGIYETHAVTDMSVFDAFQVYADKNYYTTEPEIKILGKFSRPAPALTNHKLTIKSGNRELLTLSNLTNKIAFKLSTTNFMLGKTTLGLGLLNENNDIVQEKQVEIIKRAPRPGCEWKVNQARMTLENNGKPFFPFGFWAYGPRACLASNRFNTIQYIYIPQLFNTNNLDALLNMAQSNNMYVNIVLSDFSQAARQPDHWKALAGCTNREVISQAARIKDLCAMKGFLMFNNALTTQQKDALYMEMYANQQSVIDDTINTAKHFPGLLGYVNIDEPYFNYFDMAAVCRKIYERMQAVDGYHPGFVLYSGAIPQGKKAMDMADVVGMDPYWLPGETGARGNVNYVAACVAQTKRRTDEFRKVCVVVPMASWWSASSYRAATAAEIICQTYLALIHGAKGITYYHHDLVAHEDQWQAYIELARQIEFMSGALLEVEAPQEITYTPGEFKPFAYICPDVQARLFKHPDRGYLLLAANSQNYPVETTFAIFGISGEAERWFNTGKIKIENNRFTDRLEPLGVRVYRLDNINPGDPIKLNVSALPKKDGYIEEKALPPQQLLERKNHLPNPSMENAMLRNWPDYFTVVGTPKPRIGNPGTPWTLVKEDAFHGNACLKTTGAYRFQFYIPLGLPKRPHVFSVYMKTDKPGSTVSFTLGEKHDVTLTSDKWRRYWFATQFMGANLMTSKYIAGQVKSPENATVWFDAFQFEEGSEPTVFEDK